MVLVLILGGGTGWIVQRARTQRDAVHAIQRASGSVRYDWQWKSRKLDRNAVPPGPKWFRNAIGPDLLDSVAFVGLHGQNANDAVMAHVGALRGLKGFNLQGEFPPALTSAGMAQIGKLSHLERIVVQGMSNSHGFLPYLWDKPWLRDVWLQRASITDAEMTRLGRLTRLEEIRLDGQAITDVGFAHLANLKALRVLELRRCRVSDLSTLSDLKNLEEILLFNVDLPHGRVPPVDLSPLRGMSKLVLLSLGGISIDDAGLKQIKDLKQLSGLGVYGEGITEAGIAHLALMPRISGLQFSKSSIRDLGPLAPLMPRLRTLSIRDAPIEDDGLRPLVNATSLTSLDLKGTKITDAGLKPLSGLKGLTTLLLSETQVSDAGLKYLAGLSSLRSLDLRGTAVSDVGTAALQKALPGLKINR